MSLESLFKKRANKPIGALCDSLKRPFMLGQTVYQPVLPANMDACRPLIVVGQVVNANDHAYIWVDGLDIHNPVLTRMISVNDGVSRYIDTISDFFELNQELVLMILDAANDLDLDLSPTIIARVVEILKADKNESIETALNTTLNWAQLILDLHRLHPA